MLKSGVLGSRRKEIQENHLINDLWIRKEAIDVLQHVCWHHVAEGSQSTTLTGPVTGRLVKMTNKS